MYRAKHFNPIVGMLVFILAAGMPMDTEAKSSFQENDRNRDGQLSQQEFPGPSKAFDSMDINRDGFLTPQEMRKSGGRQDKKLSSDKKQYKDRGQLREQPPAKQTFSEKERSSLLKPGGPGLTEAADNPAKLGYVETHVHLTAGSRRGVSVTYLEAAAMVLKSMDEFGILKVLIMPPPQGPLNTESMVRYESLKEVAKRYPDRFAFLGGGGSLNYMIYESMKKGTVSEKIRREFREKALEIAEAGAVGFGEMTALHFSFKPKHPFYEAPPDHPLFLLLSDISAETGLPIDFHMEAVTTDALPFPFDKRTQSSKHNPSTLKENIKPLERLLSHNRKAKVIWVHVGWDNIGHMTVGLLSRLLKDHPNLYMSLKGYSHSRSANRLLDQNDKLRPEWKDLIALYPDRFVFGCDGFYGLPGKDKSFPDSTGPSRLIVNQLPLDIARKVAYENANHIYGLKIK